MTSPTDSARELPREPTTPWILGLNALLVAAWLGVLVWQVAVLPEQVPTRFDVGGEPTQWSSKAWTLGSLLLLPLVAALPLPLLSLLALRRPEMLSVPNRDWWTATGPRIRRFERLLREDLWLITALMMMLFVSIQVVITQASATPGQSLPGWVMAVPTVVFLALLGALMARMFGGRYAEQPDLDG